MMIASTHLNSSTAVIQSVAETWQVMIDMVERCKPTQKRGLIYHCSTTDRLEYLSLLELQEKGAIVFGMDSGLFSEILALVGSGYDFETEFVFLVRQGDVYKARTGDLRPDGWQDHKTAAEIRRDENQRQLQVARQLRAALKRQRKKK